MASNARKRGRNNMNRERTASALTQTQDGPFHVPLQEQPLFPYSLGTVSHANTNSAPITNLAFGFMAPPATQLAQQQQAQAPLSQYQSSTLPRLQIPGKTDLEVLENLKDMIKNNQHEYFRPIPRPEALANVYLGPLPGQDQQQAQQQLSSSNLSHIDGSQNPDVASNVSLKTPITSGGSGSSSAVDDRRQSLARDASGGWNSDAKRTEVVSGGVTSSSTQAQAPSRFNSSHLATSPSTASNGIPSAPPQTDYKQAFPPPSVEAESGRQQRTESFQVLSSSTSPSAPSFGSNNPQRSTGDRLGDSYRPAPNDRVSEASSRNGPQAEYSSAREPNQNGISSHRGGVNGTSNSDIRSESGRVNGTAQRPPIDDERAGPLQGENDKKGRGRDRSLDSRNRDRRSSEARSDWKYHPRPPPEDRHYEPSPERAGFTRRDDSVHDRRRTEYVPPSTYVPPPSSRDPPGRQPPTPTSTRSSDAGRPFSDERSYYRHPPPRPTSGQGSGDRRASLSSPSHYEPYSAGTHLADTFASKRPPAQDSAPRPDQERPLPLTSRLAPLPSAPASTATLEERLSDAPPRSNPRPTLQERIGPSASMPSVTNNSNNEPKKASLNERLGPPPSSNNSRPPIQQRRPSPARSRAASVARGGGAAQNSTRPPPINSRPPSPLSSHNPPPRVAPKMAAPPPGLKRNNNNNNNDLPPPPDRPTKALPGGPNSASARTGPPASYERNEARNVALKRSPSTPPRTGAALFPRETVSDFRPRGENNYRPAENNYRPSENNYRPAENNYRPAENSYRPAENSYRPAENNYRPPPPPENNYRPVENNYRPGENNYRPTYSDRDSGRRTPQDTVAVDRFEPSASYKSRFSPHPEGDRGRSGFQPPSAPAPAPPPSSSSASALAEGDKHYSPSSRELQDALYRPPQRIFQPSPNYKRQSWDTQPQQQAPSQPPPPQQQPPQQADSFRRQWTERDRSYDDGRPNSVGGGAPRSAQQQDAWDDNRPQRHLDSYRPPLDSRAPDSYSSPSLSGPPPASEQQQQHPPNSYSRDYDRGRYPPPASSNAPAGSTAPPQSYTTNSRIRQRSPSPILEARRGGGPGGGGPGGGGLSASASGDMRPPPMKRAREDLYPDSEGGQQAASGSVPSYYDPPMSGRGYEPPSAGGAEGYYGGGGGGGGGAAGSAGARQRVVEYVPPPYGGRNRGGEQPPAQQGYAPRGYGRDDDRRYTMGQPRTG